MNRRLLLPLALAFAAAAPMLAYAPAALAQKGSAKAAPAINSDCPAFYHGGRAPVTVGAPGRQGDVIICRSFYAISYSTTLRDPLWTSYRLTREMVQGADSIDRRSRTFRQQEGLTRDQQGRHGDYVHPPYDRGHMTPDNDAPDRATQADTYVITNVVPQISRFNGGEWRFLEAAVHRLASAEGEVFIVTGAVFTATPHIMSRPGQTGQIAVPNATFKAVFVPARNVAVGYYATNAHPTECTVMSIADLTRWTGVNPFPSLPANVAARPTNLTLPPAPRNNPPLPDCHP